jgi:hypothetical protein
MAPERRRVRVPPLSLKIDDAIGTFSPTFPNVVDRVHARNVADR